MQCYFGQLSDNLLTGDCSFQNVTENSAAGEKLQQEFQSLNKKGTQFPTWMWLNSLICSSKYLGVYVYPITHDVCS